MRDRSLSLGLLLATLLALALRLYGLGSIPAGLYCDEALHGYEAWSLLLTGNDTRGVPFPLFFDLFGVGWGEPLYTYLTIPAVGLFGLTEFATRFVSALSGSLAVPATGLMTLALLSGLESRPFRRNAAVSAAFLMAISPWPFHLSRVGFQANLLPAGLAAGFALAALAIRRGSGWTRHLAAAFVLGACCYTYTPVRLILPLLLAGFVTLHRDALKRSGKRALFALAILVLLALPVAAFSVTERGLQRFADVSALSGSSSDGSASRLARIATNYLSYYSPSFLLTQGDSNLRHSVAGHGVLHPHDLILLAIGIFAAMTLRTPGTKFLLWWMAVFPSAAALTADPAHAVRSIAGQPSLYALAGLGVALILAVGSTKASTPRRRSYGLTAIALAIVLALASTVGYFHHYFVEYPRYSGAWWQVGLKEAYDWIDAQLPGHDSVYVTRNEDYPFIQFLFHRRFSPKEYQARRLTGTPWRFDEEVFYRGDKIAGRRNPIFLLKPWELKDSGLSARHVIRYPDGNEAFVIAW